MCLSNSFWRSFWNSGLSMISLICFRSLCFFSCLSAQLIYSTFLPVFRHKNTNHRILMVGNAFFQIIQFVNHSFVLPLVALDYPLKQNLYNFFVLHIYVLLELVVSCDMQPNIFLLIQAVYNTFLIV